MILTTLQNLGRYEPLHPLFGRVIECLQDESIFASAPGRIVVDRDNIFINVAHTVGVSKESQSLEVHRTYIDFHVLLEGIETIGYKPTQDIESYSKPYSSEDDFALSTERSTGYITLKPFDICIVYPEDAHAPLIGDGVIKKLVIKVKLEV